MLTPSKNELQLIEDENPLSMFMYGLRAKESRRQYPKRLKVFMDYCGLDGSLETQAKKLFHQAKENNIWIQSMLIKFIEFQKQRVKQGQILESTIRNYYKATKLFCEMKNSKGRKEKREMTIIPKPNEVRIWKSSLIYVPQWDITFEAKSMTYTRWILPASGTIVVNEISMCPKHFSRWKVWSSPKEVYALCDTCGQGVCKEHVTQVDSVYFCAEHAKSN